MPLTHSIHVRMKARYRQAGRLRFVRDAASAALHQAHLSAPCELSISLSDDAELRQLNCQFRDLDKSTDVLSFGGAGYRDGRRVSASRATSSKMPFFLDPSAGRPRRTPEYLGDIAISMEQCVAQATARKTSLDGELALLVVHGTLHLLGYDHNTKTRKARMWAAQTRALWSLAIRRQGTAGLNVP